MYQSFFLAVNSLLHHHWPEMQSQTGGLHLRASVAHHLHVDAPLLQATAEPIEARGILILTDLGRAPVRARRGGTEPDQDPFRPVPDPLQDDVVVVVEEIVQAGMVAEDGEVPVIAATAAMIEVEAEVADGVDGTDAKIRRY